MKTRIIQVFNDSQNSIVRFRKPVLYPAELRARVW